MLDGEELSQPFSWSRGRGGAQKLRAGTPSPPVSLARSLGFQSLCAPTLDSEVQ